VISVAIWILKDFIKKIMPNIKKVKKIKRTPQSGVAKSIKKSNLPTKHSPVDYYNCLLTAAQQD